MNDEIQRRLRRLGDAPAPSLDAAAVDRLEQRLLTQHVAHHRPRWLPLAATAAAVAAVIGIALAVRESGDNTLQPVNPPVESDFGSTAPQPSSTDPATTPAIATTSTDSTPPSSDQSVPTTAEPTRTTTAATSATSLSSGPTPTTEPLRPTTVAPTTTPPSSVPTASFRLRAARVGDRIVFRWPVYEGQGAERYVLVRVTRAGLREWPVADAQVVKIITDLSTTETTLVVPAGEVRRFVLAVVGGNRKLLAVSTVAEVA